VTLAFATPRLAAAQACCTGANALAPARLAPFEDALVGVEVMATDLYGSFDACRRFVRPPPGAAELDLEQNLLMTVRPIEHAQVSLRIPLVETWRRVPGVSEFGGSFGDLKLGVRYDFTAAGESAVVPGIALSAGVTFPSGRPPESASHPLATDATGTGAFQGSFTLGLEQSYRRFLVNLSGTTTVRASRTVGYLHERDGVQLVASGTGGYSFRNGVVLALTASYTAELEATINGAMVPDSGRAVTRLGLAGSCPLTPAFRVQGSFFVDPKIRYFARNQPVGVGIAFTVIRSWSL
jgi:hypothetical protein